MKAPPLPLLSLFLLLHVFACRCCFQLGVVSGCEGLQQTNGFQCSFGGALAGQEGSPSGSAGNLPDDLMVLIVDNVDKAFASWSLQLQQRNRGASLVKRRRFSSTTMNAKGEAVLWGGQLNEVSSTDAFDGDEK